MRVAVLFAVCGLACAQAPDAAYDTGTRAYEALKAKDYDTAIDGFLKAVEAAPLKAGLRKDLAYTYLKVGETELARDQFREAMRLEPANTHVALEYAFLCYETQQQAEARRIFDRIRQTGDATAEQAFQNVDRPLREGIDRWKSAIVMGADNFSAHFELASLAERRDELELAAEHYQKAWKLLPDRRSVLVDLGRVWKALNRTGDAGAALLAAAYGGETRSAESARELLPDRYPFVPEFRLALELDPGNVGLRRELGYLLLRMGRPAEAEPEFAALTRIAPGDLLAATQLGFLLWARGDRAGATPLFERVLAGNDEDLANRVRAVMRVPQVLKPRIEPGPSSIDAKIMAERSIKAGYLKDALRYLETAHEADPVDFSVMLKLGWTHNLLRQDQLAVRWFDLARRSPDPQIASEALRAYKNLRDSYARFRVTAWIFPLYSTRWSDFFSYGQVKAEARIGLPVRPYLSLRFVGDTRLTLGAGSPEYLSESSFILGAGLTTRPWRGITAWGEAGSAIRYVRGGGMTPDYRGGVSFVRGFGKSLLGESSGWFGETGADGVFMSRFGNDFLVYAQNRAGYTAMKGPFRAQLYWNGNLTRDTKREYWANFAETGPGVRLRGDVMPRSMYFTVNLLRGKYSVDEGNPRRPVFHDFRAGFWYAFTY